MNVDLFKKIFKCSLYITMSVFVLCAFYVTFDLAKDGMTYRKLGCVANDPFGLLAMNDPLGLLTDPVTGRIRAPETVNRMKAKDIREWFKTLPKKKRDEVKAEYLRIITNDSE